MTAYGTDDELPTVELRRIQTIFIPQLERSMASMHHIDELFQWLGNAFVHYFHIQLLLVWTNRIDQYGQSAPQLRTMAHQDASFPEQIIINDQTQRLAQHLIIERLNHKPQPLETLFSHYQTLLLKRYGMQYWGACFVGKNALIPARGDLFAREGSPAFLAMLTLFLLKQLPQANTIQSMSFVLEKAMDSALSRGLLLLPPEPQFPFPLSLPATPFPFPEQMQTPPAPEQRLHLDQLIPEQKQDADLMLADNPFKQAVVIADKNARRLHTAINGHATVAKLCSVTGMSIQEISVALRLLWEQDRIEVHGPDGKSVNLLFFLSDR